jgi:hypothetical protein
MKTEIARTITMIFSIKNPTGGSTMKLHIFEFCAAICTLALSGSALADTAIYRDDKLMIPAGAVINASGQFYYKDIVLQADANGRLRVMAASPRPLVYIDSVNATVVETQTVRSVEISIAGNKSVPCVSLEEVAVSRKDAVFTVLVAETVMGPAESCIAIVSPFDLNVPLDVSGLPAGTYKVVVNGEEASFVLTRGDTRTAGR